MICEYRTRAEFEDCDVGGVVYHANYLNYFERARSAAWQEVTGKTFKSWVDQGYCLVVAKIQCEYRMPVNYYDPVYVYTEWKDLGSRSLNLTQYIFTEPHANYLHSPLDSAFGMYTRAEITLVCIDLKSRKAVSFPEEIRMSFEKCEDASLVNG